KLLLFLTGHHKHQYKIRAEAKRYISLTRGITSPGKFPGPEDQKIFFSAHFPGRLRDSTLLDIEFSEI
ncbi:MAG: hypothetical protein V1789_06975, partial [PVC group bacterium]